MAVASVSRLVEMVRESGVLSPEQQQELLRLQDGFEDPPALTGELIRRGWLTAYQEEQFLAGNYVDLIVGQYILLEPLGEGGMAQVFKARNLDTGEIAALKVIRKDRWLDSKVVRRFHREIEAVAQLSHPNLVQASSASEEENRAYLAMEYCDGVNLDRVIAAHGPLPVAPACDYIRQAALGLQHIHERGLIHRDIKPANLLIIPPRPADRSNRHGHWGTIKILDLGFVLLQRPGLEETQSQLTKKGFLLGTVDYTAPEQAANPHEVDIRADLYSLGCSFYEMVAGRLPFLGTNPFKKLHQHQVEEPESVLALRPDLPGEVAAVIRKLMAKSPDQRYQQPAELAAEISRVLDRLHPAEMPWDWKPGQAGPAAAPAQPAPPAEKPIVSLLKSLAIALILTVALLALLHFISGE